MYIKKTSRLKLFWEEIGVYCDNNKTFCGKMRDFLMLQQAGFQKAELPQVKAYRVT